MQELRPYQEDITTQVHASSSKRLVVYAPTGAGKTIIACQLIQDFLAQGLRVLVLVDQVTLIGQTSEKLSSWHIYHGFVKAGKPEDRTASVQVASTQTLIRRDWWKQHPFDVVILDECHTTSFSKAAKTLRKIMPQARHIGLTATPMRAAKHEGLGDIFDTLISTPLPSELMDMGYLVRPTYYKLAEVDLQGVTVKCGDYDPQRLSVICNTPEQVEQAISEYLRLTPEQPALAFATDIAHANALAEEAQRQGIKAAAISSKTKAKDRERYLHAYASGQLTLLASCGCLSVGFDQPKASVALLCRPTKSPIIYQQQVERVLRTLKGKEKAWVLDFAGNVFKHGRVEDITAMSLDYGESMTRGSGKPPIKVCPGDKTDRNGKVGCSAIIPLFSSECPHCGYLFGNPKVIPTGRLQQDNKSEIDRLFAIAEKWPDKARAKRWLWANLHKLPDLSQADFEHYGKLMGYNNPKGWAWYQVKNLEAKTA